MSTWGKIHGSITWHTKALSAGDAALGVWVRLLGHCAQHLTDGHIPQQVAKAVGATSPGAINALVEAGLLEVVEGGYRLHDYLEHNSSRAEIEASREASRDRKARSRSAAKSMLSRVTDAVTPTVTGRVTGRVTDAGSHGVRPFAGERERDLEQEHRHADAPVAQPALPLDGPKPAAVAAPSASAGGLVGQVFDHWRKVHKHPAAKLDGPRRAVIERALRSHGLEVVLAAIDGCARSPHHQGQNDRGQVYDGLGLILRNAEKIESFARMANAAPIGLSSGSKAPGTGVGWSGASGRLAEAPSAIVRSVETRTPEQIRLDAQAQAKAAREAMAAARAASEGGDDDE